MDADTSFQRLPSNLARLEPDSVATILSFLADSGKIDVILSSPFGEDLKKREGETAEDRVEICIFHGARMSRCDCVGCGVDRGWICPASSNEAVWKRVVASKSNLQLEALKNEACECLYENSTCVGCRAFVCSECEALAQCPGCHSAVWCRGCVDEKQCICSEVGFLQLMTIED